MSKRFGRNQKRKLKQKINSLELSLADAENTRKYALRLEQDIKRWSDQIRKYLGIYSSFNKAEKVLNGNLRAVSIPQNISGFLSEQVMCDSIGREFMNRFCVVADNLPYEAKKLIRLIEVDGRANSVYYSISDKQLHTFGLPDDFMPWLSNQIAENLVKLMSSSDSRGEEHDW